MKWAVTFFMSVIAATLALVIHTAMNDKTEEPTEEPTEEEPQDETEEEENADPGDDIAAVSDDADRADCDADRKVTFVFPLVSGRRKRLKMRAMQEVGFSIWVKNDPMLGIFMLMCRGDRRKALKLWRAWVGKER